MSACTLHSVLCTLHFAPCCQLSLHILSHCYPVKCACSFFHHAHATFLNPCCQFLTASKPLTLSPPISLSSSSHTMFPGCSCWSGCYQSGRLAFPQRRWPHCWYSCTRCRQKQKGEETRRSQSRPCRVWLISCSSLSTYHHNYMRLSWLSSFWYVYQLCTSPTLNDTALWTR